MMINHLFIFKEVLTAVLYLIYYSEMKHLMRIFNQYVIPLIMILIMLCYWQKDATNVLIY